MLVLWSRFTFFFICVHLFHLILAFLSKILQSERCVDEERSRVPRNPLPSLNTSLYIHKPPTDTYAASSKTQTIPILGILAAWKISARGINPRPSACFLLRRRRGPVSTSIRRRDDTGWDGWRSRPSVFLLFRRSMSVHLQVHLLSPLHISPSLPPPNIIGTVNTSCQAPPPARRRTWWPRLGMQAGPAAACMGTSIRPRSS